MHCPRCGSETQVSDSRDGESSIRRRRSCVSCKYRFTTFERIEPPAITVEKRGGDVQRFDPDKIRRGIATSCKNRPVTTAQIDELVEQVCTKVYDLGVDKLPSSQIGTFVQAALQEADQVAYLRFTSVCQAFNDVAQFEQTITKLQQPS
jgi:transcriptional repressor NrdR